MVPSNEVNSTVRRLTLGPPVIEMICLKVFYTDTKCYRRLESYKNIAELFYELGI